MPAEVAAHNLQADALLAATAEGLDGLRRLAEGRPPVLRLESDTAAVVREPAGPSDGGGAVFLWRRGNRSARRRPLDQVNLDQGNKANQVHRARRPRINILRLSLTLALAAGLLAALSEPAAAATQTTVSLTFDNGTISQYTLGYLKALQPHNAAATFLVNSGTVGASGNFVSWAQLSTLSAAGNDIGGHTVNATNLTTDPNPTAQVCNDRTALLQHGLTPVAFAYPGGATNSTVKAIVKGCGYGNGRTAGSLSPTGPVYAESLPPADWFGTRAYAPTAVTLANVQALVLGAASHNGGWSQVVIGKICSQALDPANYSTCSTSSGHIELDDLNAFLDWMAAAGQPGGAPSGATLNTERGVITAADTSAPASTIACNLTACSSSPYPGVVSISLSATDVASGVASIHYTLDGTDPSLSSPTYTAPFNVNGSASSTTVKFRSWDFAGNAEAVNTQLVQAPPDTAAPVTTIACGAAACTTTPYVGSVSVSLSATDTGGSGLAATYYTTDGSTPTTASTTYSTPVVFSSPGIYAVRFFSTDHAGNVEAVQSQSIQVVPVKTKVALTFDNGTVSQYALGYLQALKPRAANATFFVNSGTIGVSANTMTWAQVGALAAAGNEVGGKSVSSTNLTTDPNPTSQICDDRATLIQHGVTPGAFAYPGGFVNASVEAIVKSCGYGNARTAGSVAPAGPTYAETLPPKDWYATRTYAPNTQVTLANLQALVTGAAAHNGGWAQIVIGRICSQTLDAANYPACTASAGWIELTDLDSFLDWIGNAGQAGGAPAGAALTTERDAAAGADTLAPTTTITCNGSACASTQYSTTVYASLSSTDVGSAVASTHYTSDGSDPALSSPTYTAPIPITGTTTLKFRSWDNAGNAEAVNTQTIQVSLPPDSTPPTTTIYCDGSACGGTGYNGTTTVTLTATDVGGWGVDKTYYTTDGSTPSTSSTTYSTAFTLSPGTYQVRYFSVDLAGNTESPQSQQIVVLPPRTVVSLSFDDGIENQYQLGYLRALQPHHTNGTFFINTGSTGVSDSAMTWAQLSTLNNAGNEIAGHTLHEYNLKTSTDPQLSTTEVCQDRQNLVQHGFDPVSFAYPYGAYDAASETLVKSCGYTSGRAAGGIDVAGSGAGPSYAETIPPKDVLATRTVYDPATGTPPNVPPLSLDHMEAAVISASQHGGGWITFAFHEICSQALDPGNYANCIGDWGPVELDTLNGLLDWLQNAGQAGGAPVRTQLATISQVINGADQQAPVTTLECDGSPCQTSTYGGSTTVSLLARDPGGSGIAATYYTTDGSTPTTASPVYSKPFLITGPMTVRFFSVDNAANTEAIGGQQITVAANADPVVGSAGDIACDPSAPAFNGGLGTDTDCRAADTVKLLKGVDAVLPLGDNQYDCGGAAAYAQSYDPTWGVLKPITHPVPGDKDWGTTGGTDCPTTPGAGYYSYFGSAAGDPAKGYYSYNLGSWHIIALNTAPCPADATTCSAGSAQDLWLQQDLAASTSQCTLAYYQNPRWASTASGSGGDPTYQQLWQDLYNGGADVVLNGDSHWYERFQPLNASGASDPTYGVRQFIVGTGGAGLDTPGAKIATSQALNATTHGVIRLTLHNGSYGWQFVPDEGTFTDSGTANCHAAPPGPDSTAPVTTAACNTGACQTAPYAPPVSLTLTATDNVGGWGVASTHYTTDGTDPSLTSPTYTGAVPISATTTVKYRSWDLAGNVEATKTQLVTVDATAPVTTASCNGAACQSAPYFASVSVALSAVDTGGSGLSSIHYTTDGTDPSLTSPAYTAPFTVTANTSLKYRSWDKAGNVEATRSLALQVTPDAPPVARVTLSNATGVFPLSVTANASTSTDTDPTPIASYAFDFGDGSAPITQAGASATHTYTKAGSFTVTVTATDTAHLSSSATAPVTSQQNLVSNGGFETNTAGWVTGNSSVSSTRVSGGHSGNFSDRIANNGTAAVTCTLDDSPNSVALSAAGTYTATMWVKGGLAGSVLSLRLRELGSGATVVGSATATVSLTASWQLITVSYAVKQPGATALDLNAFVGNVAAGAVAFFADDVTLTHT